MTAPLASLAAPEGLAQAAPERPRAGLG